MKKLLVVLFLALVSMVSMGQKANSFVDFAADSTLNAETVYLVISSPTAIKLNHAVTLNLVPVNTSGTATVTCVVQGSSDNAVWFDLASSADTVNNAGTVATVKYEYADAYWRYYRYKLVSTGTGVTHFTGELGLKKK
jgi:hypothetical protein